MEVIYYSHFDVWGPALTRSHGGAHYFVSFLDDYLRKIWVYFMHEKSKVFLNLKDQKAEVENQTGHKVNYLWSDNGGEYNDQRFIKFYQ